MRPAASRRQWPVLAGTRAGSPAVSFFLSLYVLMVIHNFVGNKDNANQEKRKIKTKEKDNTHKHGIHLTPT